MSKIVLALGGGGARGLAHMGVLKAFERSKMPIYGLSGTSMGAIVGACFAANPSAIDTEKRIKKVLSSSTFTSLKVDFFKQSEEDDQKSVFAKAKNMLKNGYIAIAQKTRDSMVDINKLELLINELIPDIDITETKIKFNCVAADLTNGTEVVFTKGRLRQAVLASSSISGVFAPVKIKDVFYTDGGAVSVTPIDSARMLGGDFVVAVNVKSKIFRWENKGIAGDVVSRSNHISGIFLNELLLKKADFVITPEISHLHWTEFGKVELIVNKGESAAEACMPDIKKKVILNSFKGRILNLFGRGR